MPEVGLELHSGPCKPWELRETCGIRAPPASIRPGTKPKVWTMSAPFLLLYRVIPRPESPVVSRRPISASQRRGVPSVLHERVTQKNLRRRFILSTRCSRNVLCSTASVATASIQVLRFPNALVSPGGAEIAHIDGVDVPATRAAEAVICALRTGGKAGCMYHPVLAANLRRHPLYPNAQNRQKQRARQVTRCLLSGWGSGRCGRPGAIVFVVSGICEVASGDVAKGQCRAEVYSPGRVVSTHD